MSQETSSILANQPLRTLIEQNATLIEILKHQNDRIARLEAEGSDHDTGEALINEAEESQKVGLDAGGDDSEAFNERLYEPAHFAMDDCAMVMSVWPDPGQAVLTNTATTTSWHSTAITHYMEPSPLPFVSIHRGGLLTCFPEWKSWFRSKFWIPADRRLPLAFDVDHLNQCETINQVVSKYQALHEFNQRLCHYNGRLLIIDNDTLGENRVCGNLVERRGWRRGFLSNMYSLHCDNDGNRLSRVIDKHGLKEIPPMTWITIDGTIAGARAVAPWRRLIIIEGLVGVRLKNYLDRWFDFNLSSFWADSDSTMPGYGLTMKKFLTASTQAFSSSEGYSFRYTWFFSISHEQIQRWSQGSAQTYEPDEPIIDPELLDMSWIRLLKVGKLYGSSKSMIARDAYYFKMIYADNTDDESGHGMNNFWSAVVFRRPSWKSNASMLPIFHAQLQVLSNSNEALSCIIDDSTEIVDHIGSLLDIGDEVLLDPDRHDELLFDDEAFSRSRTYWWTLNMLTAMQQSLTETLAVRQEMWDTVIEPLVSIDDWPLGTEAVFRKDKTLVKEFMKLKDRMFQQHQRAEALRSGLFNASGVVESRASTRLGEIVKLLTYVSIFYLPLSFSTSLWSTTDQIRGLNTAIMFGVMIGLGILTYTLVFNLNNLTRAVYQQYERAKLPWTREMEKDGGVWKDRAIRYHGFRIKRFDTSPSDWLLIWYIITWPARRFLTPKATSSTAQKENVPQHPTDRRDKSKGADDPNDGGWLDDHPPFPPWEDTPQIAQRLSSFANTQPANPEPARQGRLSKLFRTPKPKQKDTPTTTESAVQQAPKVEV